MSIVKPARGRRDLWLRLMAMAAALMVAGSWLGVAQPAAAAAYIGAELSDVKPEDKASVASPQPVQILFEFRTKGAPNAQATKLLKAKVIEAVRASGVFSDVSEQPVANGAVLNVVIDNVVDPEAMRRAQAQGAVTGATMFIAGSNVRDDYIATIDYVAAPGAPTITRQARHYIIIQMGLINSAPEGAVKVGKTMDAVVLMAQQIVANPLNDIAKDPGFTGAPSAAPLAASAEPPAETPMETLVETPVETSVETPAETPAAEPVESAAPQS